MIYKNVVIGCSWVKIIPFVWNEEGHGIAVEILTEDIILYTLSI